MVAFATALLLNTLSWLFEQRPARKQLCFLAVYISGVAFVYEFLAWCQLAPVFITAAGRPNSLLRYVMWGHATPAMLYALSLISDFEPRRVTATIAVDIIMIATVIPGELIFSWERWIWNGISCAVFPYIFYQLWSMYSDAIESAGEFDRAAATSLRALQFFTVLFWTMFPIVWVLVQANWVTVTTEEILWSCADICGKIFFSSSLLHGNFVTIESRRLSAMRAIEESNRIKAIHELQQLVEQKEGFIALMSHELRTPLNGIIGLSNSLLMDLEPSGETARTVATIRNSGARLLNLINDILDAAALRKGRLVVGRNRVILQHAVQDVLELTMPLAKPGVRVLNRVLAEVPPVVGDTSRLVQVLYNLMGNACKFTERGEIVIEARLDPDSGMVEVSVKDTGIGIPKDKLLDIFSPFEQVDMSARRQYGGTGLGLNLAKQLIEAHEGTISVASSPSEGSTFTFTLPVWKASMKAKKRNSDSTDTAPSPSKSRFFLARHSSGSDRPLLAHSDKHSEEHGSATTEGSGDAGRPSMDIVEMRRTPSVVDLLQRLSHDADPANMLERLSMDVNSRKSFEFEKDMFHKAPQQVTAEEASAAFVTASAPLRPNDAQASSGRQGAPGASASQGQSPLSPMKLSGMPSLGAAATWPAAAAAVAAAEQAGDVHVLSVDDDPVNQMVVQTMLRRAGFKVSKAADGYKALDMLSDAAENGGRMPDLVLLDVMMPGMSGHDVVRAIRERYASLVLPVILVSANGHEDQVVEGLQAGASDYITKPLGQRQLVARINNQLRTKWFLEAATVAAAATAGTASKGRDGGVDGVQVRWEGWNVGG